MIEKVIAGLQILAKYSPKEWCSAEHDVLYAPGPDPSTLSDDERAKLEEYGFHYDEEFESWMKFT